MRRMKRFNREGPADKFDIGLNAVLGVIDNDPEPLQGLLDLNADRASGDVHPLHIEAGAGMETDLHPVPDNAEMGINHVQMRIDTKGHREHPIAFSSIAIEEIAVIKVPVGAGIGDGLRGLVKGIVVPAGQGHVCCPSLCRFHTSSNRLSRPYRFVRGHVKVLCRLCNGDEGSSNDV
ncbi:MAG: hypothetical protein RLZZ141_624, partial [Pseudomonadota bacterium]